MQEPSFGKIIDETTYVNGKPQIRRRSVEDSSQVSGILDALSAMGTSLRETLPHSQNRKIIFEVEADKDFNPTRVISRIQTERNKS